MTVDELLILTEDAIEYDALDVSLLGELARQPIEPFIATTALAKLHGRDELRAQAVCVEILWRDDAERHLQAFPMTMLCSIDAGLAVAEMERLAHEDSHALLVGAMIENVMSGRDRFDHVHELVARLRALSEERFPDSDEVAAFVEWCSLGRGPEWSKTRSSSSTVIV